MSGDDDNPSGDDTAAAPSEEGAAAPADPFADLKAADQAAEERAAAEAAAPEPAGPSETESPAEDPFAALKAADQAAEERAAAESESAVAETVEQAAEVEAPVVDDISDEDTPPVEEAVAAAVFRYDEKFYAPILPDAPAGAAIEYYHFSEMDQVLAWPQNEFGRPDVAQRPNFRAVRDSALSFLNGTKEIKATRDVRPMLTLAIAEAGDKGPVGLARALDLFVTFATSHWDALHPQKEDGDDDELMMRMEEMRKYMNPQIISMAVDSVGIAKSPRVGALTTRTFAIASSKVSPREGEFAPNTDALTALLSEEEEARASVIEAHDAYHFAIDRLRTMEAFLEEHPDVDPVDLGAVATALEGLAAHLTPFVGSAGTAPVSGESESGGAEGDVAMASGPSTPVSGPKTLPEAMALLDDVLMFYAQSGRSSPVPLGLIALRDLMASDFNSWISQTASSGLANAAINLSGVDASRLSSFASGDVPQAAPPPPVEIDFSAFDPAIYDAETAYAELDKAVYALQITLPAPEDGAEPPLNAEVAKVRAALDQIHTAKAAIIDGQKTSLESGTSNSENSAEGDGRHSRITDRNGVKQALDVVAAYFEREEPSSPAPAYLRRLRSLVDARFAEIARELMPEEGGEAKLRLEPRTNLR